MMLHCSVISVWQKHAIMAWTSTTIRLPGCCCYRWVPDSSKLCCVVLAAAACLPVPGAALLHWLVGAVFRLLWGRCWQASVIIQQGKPVLQVHVVSPSRVHVGSIQAQILSKYTTLDKMAKLKLSQPKEPT